MRLGKRPAGKGDFLTGEAHGIEIEASLVEVGGGDVGGRGFCGHHVEAFGSSAVKEKIVDNANFRFGHNGWGGILSPESYPRQFLCKEL